MVRALAPLLLLLLAGCNRQPQWYPPPEQHQPIPLSATAPVSSMIEMGDPGVDDHIIRDVGPEQEKVPWRWAKKRPTLRVLVLDTKGLKFVADFSLWDEAMKQTGPVTISFFIGDKALDQIRYDTPGAKHYETPVNPDWLQSVNDTEFGAEIDRVYTSPLDGAQFGFILSRMGFVRQ